jgi:hypothetical protein
MALTKGQMPDITPPQIVAMVVGGIPLVAELLRAFGIYDLNLEQQAALSNVVTWAGVLAAALIGGDALLRTGRNLRKGKVEAAEALPVPSYGGAQPSPPPSALPPAKAPAMAPPPDSVPVRGGTATGQPPPQ